MWEWKGSVNHTQNKTKIHFLVLILFHVVCSVLLASDRQIMRAKGHGWSDDEWGVVNFTPRC